jgi:hypothetical protein
MAKFKVTVTVTASANYTVEVEARDWHRAEELAVGEYADKSPSDFSVDKGYITGWDTESEQLTANCPDCGVEHGLNKAAGECWQEDQDYCLPCGKLIEDKERTDNGG